MSSCILEIFVILYTLYLLFKKSKSIRQAEDVPVLKSTYAGRCIYLTCTGNFYFWILLPRREIYFLRLVITLPQLHEECPFKVAYTGPLFLGFTTALYSESDGGGGGINLKCINASLCCTGMRK